MTEYNYITLQEVQKVCADIGLSDWTSQTGASVDDDEVAIIRNIVGNEALEISLDDFKLGLEVELEHGTKFPDANVSNNHPIVTGQIVLAHLKEGLDYYERLKCMELEMELTNALMDRDTDRAAQKRGNLAQARAALEERIASQLGHR